MVAGEVAQHLQHGHAIRIITIKVEPVGARPYGSLHPECPARNRQRDRHHIYMFVIYMFTCLVGTDVSDEVHERQQAVGRYARGRPEHRHMETRAHECNHGCLRESMVSQGAHTAASGFLQAAVLSTR